MAIEKVACQYCGKEVAKAGLKNHEKSCPENPDNKVSVTGETEDVVVTENKLDEEVTPEVTVDEVRVKEVKVKMKESIECYIGDRYWRLKAGKEYTVPENVKDILMGAGMLDAL